MRTHTLVAALAACGGGGGHDEPPATSEVPPSASASIDGWIDYLKKLVASSADTLEPVDTAGVNGPTDETSEPRKVD
jgi:hypothetical protein